MGVKEENGDRENILPPIEQISNELDTKVKKYLRGEGANLEVLQDKKLKGQLAVKEELYGKSAKAAAKVEKWLLPSEGGYLEAEGVEKTWRIKHEAIAQEVDILSSRSQYDIVLPGLMEALDPMIEEVENCSSEEENNEATNINPSSATQSKSPSPKKRKYTKKAKSKLQLSNIVDYSVWDHFEKIVVDGAQKAKCNYCGDDYMEDSRFHCTTNLRTHIDVRCKKYPYRVVDPKQQTLKYEKVVDGRGVGNLKAVHFTIEEARIMLARMIIVDELAFKMVEGEGFRNYSQYLNPRMIVPSRISIARDCLKMYQNEKMKLKNIIKDQRVCLTTNTWTSIQNLNYMCLTAHWIDDDWKFQKRILNFCQVPNHTGETIGKFIEACMLDWGIDKIFTITVDNASSNDGAIRYITRRTKEWSTTILGHKFLHMRCCAHIINLIVKDGLRDNNEVIEKIRNAVRYVRSSPARKLSFKSSVEREKIECKSLLCLDVETRWNSTYLMLEAAEIFEKAFYRLEDDDPRFRLYFDGVKIKGPPRSDDWSRCRCLVKFLQVFYDVTLSFSGSLHMTSNNFFNEFVRIQTILLQYAKSGDVLLEKMAIDMKKKFDKYWENPTKVNWVLFVGIVLDPRCKMKYVKFFLSQIYDIFKAFDVEARVQDALNDLYKYFKDETSVGTSSGVSVPTTNENILEDKSNFVGEARKILNFQFKKYLLDEQSVETQCDMIRYLADGCEEDSETFDLLNWWKVNSSKYPTLSKVARSVLSIPISTVASEFTFSTGGRIIDPFRSSLAPATVEALICAQNWLRSMPTQIDLRAAMDDVEKFEEFASELSGSSFTGTIEPNLLGADMNEDVDSDDEFI